MENRVIVIEQKEADQLAEKYFAAMCGFNRNPEKFKSMLQSGMAIRDKIKDSISIRAVVSSFGPESVSGRRIKIKSLGFDCNALEQMDKDSILKTYAYVLTVGKIDFDSDSVLEMFYADTWGTAYVDAARDILGDRIQEDILGQGFNRNEVFVSDSFGPGYYGMDMTQLQYFFQILETDSIGVQLSGYTMMLPLKSCAGFFIVVGDADQLPGEDCRSCLAESKGCNFCRKKLKETTLSEG